MWRAGLGEHVAVVAERGGLGAALVLQVLQPLRRQLAEGHAALAALTLARLDCSLLAVVLGDQLSHAHRRALLIEVALRYSPAPHDPPAVVRRPLEPRRPHAALHLSPCAAPLGLVGGTVRAARNYERAGWITAALLSFTRHLVQSTT